MYMKFLAAIWTLTLITCSISMHLIPHKLSGIWHKKHNTGLKFSTIYSDPIACSTITTDYGTPWDRIPKDKKMQNIIGSLSLDEWTDLVLSFRYLKYEIFIDEDLTMINENRASTSQVETFAGDGIATSSQQSITVLSVNEVDIQARRLNLLWHNKWPVGAIPGAIPGATTTKHKNHISIVAALPNPLDPEGLPNGKVIAILKNPTLPKLHDMLDWSKKASEEELEIVICEERPDECDQIDVEYITSTGRSREDRDMRNLITYVGKTVWKNFILNVRWLRWNTATADDRLSEMTVVTNTGANVQAFPLEYNKFSGGHVAVIPGVEALNHPPYILIVEVESDHEELPQSSHLEATSSFSNSFFSHSGQASSTSFSYASSEASTSFSRPPAEPDVEVTSLTSSFSRPLTKSASFPRSKNSSHSNDLLSPSDGSNNLLRSKSFSDFETLRDPNVLSNRYTQNMSSATQNMSSALSSTHSHSPFINAKVLAILRRPTSKNLRKIAKVEEDDPSETRVTKKRSVKDNAFNSKRPTRNEWTPSFDPLQEGEPYHREFASAFRFKQKPIRSKQKPIKEVVQTLSSETSQETEETRTQSLETSQKKYIDHASSPGTSI